jgi:integrase
LTQTNVRNLQPAEGGKPREVRDTMVPNLLVRVAQTSAGIVTRDFKVIERTDSGKRRPRTLGRFPALSVDEARKLATGVVVDVEVNGNKPVADADNPTLKTFVEKTYVPHARAAGKNADDLARQVLRDFPPTVRMRDITPAMVEEWRLAIFERTGAATANRYTGNLAGVLNVAVGRGIIKKNPASTGRGGALVKYDESNDPSRYFTAEEWAAVDAALDDTVPRWFADLMRVAIGCGGRKAELLALTWSDVDLEKGTVSFRAGTTKTGKARTVPVSKAALETLRRRAADCGDDGSVFNGDTNGDVVQYRFDQALAAAGVEKTNAKGTLSFRSTRTTFASWLVQRSHGNIFVVSKLLGHADPKLTAAEYGYLAQDNLRDVVSLLD